MSTENVEVRLSGFTFEFDVDPATEQARSVRVVCEQPDYYEQTFELPDDVDPTSYAVGWWQCYVRRFIHLL